MSDERSAAPQPMDERAFLAELSRQLVVKATELRHALIGLAAQAPRAPIGSCLSLVDVACALYYQYVNLDVDTPGSPRRDRVILSKSEALLLLQPILAELGLLPEAAYTTLAAEPCRIPGVPEIPPCPGLDLAPRLSGTGLGIALGHALAGQMQRGTWRVYCLMSDTECTDGAVWEAAIVAAHYRLGNLVAVIDRTKLAAAGPTLQVLDIEPLAGKWWNMGWEVIEIDGQNMEHIVWALETLPPPTEPKPVVIVANTAAGAGVDFMRDRPEWLWGRVTGECAERAQQSITHSAAEQMRGVR